MNHIFAIIILNLLSNKMGDGSADGCVKVLTKIKKQVIPFIMKVRSWISFPPNIVPDFSKL